MERTGPEIPTEAVATGYLHDLNHLLGDFYTLPKLAGERPLVRVGQTVTGTLPRVGDRTSSIERFNGSYSLNAEDLGLFSQELFYVLGNYVAAIDEQGVNEDAACQLFVGLGVAGSVAQEVLSSAKVSPLKTTSHAKELRGFLADHHAIDEIFEDVFGDIEKGKGILMAVELSDTRAMQINGLRMRFRLLFDTPGVEERLGFNYETLITQARENIRATHDLNHEYYVETLINSMSIEEDTAVIKADQMFFNSLPDWLIAAAAPMRHNEFSALLSPAWKFNPATNPMGH